jgi:membrane protease YdiL (CAAX protease family)
MVRESGRVMHVVPDSPEPKPSETEPASRTEPSKTQPASGVALKTATGLGIWGGLFTALAFALVCVTAAENTAYRWNYPNLSLENPGRALLKRADFERRAAQAETPPDAGAERKRIEAEGIADVEKAWEALREEQERWTGTYAPTDLYRQNRRESIPALDVALAGWGVPAAVERLRTRPDEKIPEYLRGRVAEIEEGRLEPERARIASAGRWSSLLFWLNAATIAAGAAGAALLWKGRRAAKNAPGESAAPQTPLLFGRAQGMCLFLGVLAAREALFRISWMELGATSAAIQLFHSALLAVIVMGALSLTRLAPSARPVSDMLGWPRDRRAGSRAMGAALVTLAVTNGFASLLDYAPLGTLAPSWSEGLDGTLLYGSALKAAGGIAEYLIGAPISEEFLFRGLLFSALLPRPAAAQPTSDVPAGTHRAALISGFLFALWHGYGLIGTLDLTVCGYALARLYAHTGSLVPCILAHSAMNVVPALWGLALRG